MTIALRYGDDDSTDQTGLESGFIYFDAVTAYSKSIRGQVTKNPISYGKFATDHFVRDNPSFQLSGVISVADLANNTLIRDEQGRIPNNYIEQPPAVSISNSSEGLINYLPASISQFFQQQGSDVSQGDFRTNYKEFVSMVLTNLMSGEKYNEKTERTETKIRFVKLYEFTGSDLTAIIPQDTSRGGLVLTGFDVSEDPDTGDALICNLSFEMVKIVNIKKTALPSDVKASMKKKVEGKAKKGSADSKPQTVNTVEQAKTEDVDPLIEAAKSGGKN